jgi:hypothetical protein
VAWVVQLRLAGFDFEAHQAECFRRRADNAGGGSFDWPPATQLRIGRGERGYQDGFRIVGLGYRLERP